MHRRWQMHCGAKTKPTGIRIATGGAAVSSTDRLCRANFRIPCIRKSPAIQALGLAIALAKDARTFAAHVGSNQSERRTRNEWIVGQRRSFPLISYPQEILKCQLRPGRRYSQLLRATLQIFGRRWEGEQ